MNWLRKLFGIESTVMQIDRSKREVMQIDRSKRQKYFPQSGDPVKDACFLAWHCRQNAAYCTTYGDNLVIPKDYWLDYADVIEALVKKVHPEYTGEKVGPMPRE